MLQAKNVWLIVSTGILGFTLTIVYDLLQFRSEVSGRSVIATAGGIFVSLATAGLFFLNPFPLQDWWVNLAGYLLVLLSATMLIRSTILEIPHDEIAAGSERILIESGSYATIRHPGFLWYLILIASTVMIYRDRTVAQVGAILLLLDLVVVTIEDWLLFPRFIPGYREYRKRVPMLFPIRFRKRKTDSQGKL